MAVVTATIGHAGEEVVVAPEFGDGGAGWRSGHGAFFEHGVVAGDEVEAFAVGGFQDGVDAVVTAGVELAEHFDFVRDVVGVAVGDAIEAAGDFFLVVIHADVEGAEGEEHAVDAADVGGHFLDVAGFEGLACGRGGEAVEAAVLVGGVDAAFVIGAEVDPGALFAAGDGVEEFDFEVGEGLDAGDGGGDVGADSGADGVGAFGFGRGFGGGFAFAFALGVGLLGG